MAYGAGFLLLGLFAKTTFPPGEAARASPPPPLLADSLPPGVEAVPLAELLEAYRGDVALADARFRERTVRTAGEVVAVRTDLAGRPYVKLGTGGGFAFFGVQCLLEGRSRLAALPPQGAWVTVQGRVAGRAASVMLGGCTVVPEAPLPTADSARP